MKRIENKEEEKQDVEKKKKKWIGIFMFCFSLPPLN